MKTGKEKITVHLNAANVEWLKAHKTGLRSYGETLDHILERERLYKPLEARVQALEQRLELALNA